MIRIQELAHPTDFGLFLADGTFVIQKSVEDYFYIESSLAIVIEKNIVAKIVDCTKTGTIEITVLEDAVLEYQILNSSNATRTFQCGGKLDIMEISLEETKENIRVELVKPTASVAISLLAFGNAFAQEFSQTIVHKDIRTTSNISNFGVAMDGANILFDTCGKIEQKMAKSHCVQLSKGIIMDDDSCITSKPILLIDEYDVIANHGASIGKMSDESLFYLMSRGLTKQEAFLLILEGIIGPFLEKIVDENWKKETSQKLELWIKR